MISLSKDTCRILIPQLGKGIQVNVYLNDNDIEIFYRTTICIDYVLLLLLII